MDGVIADKHSDVNLTLFIEPLQVIGYVLGAQKYLYILLGSQPEEPFCETKCLGLRRVENAGAARPLSSLNTNKFQR